VVLAIGGYGAQSWVIRVEDLFLWFRLYAAGYKAMNLQEPLYRVRDDVNANNRRTFAARFNETRVRWKGFRMLGLAWHKQLWAIKPILVWALPDDVYHWLRGRRLKRVAIVPKGTEHDLKEGGQGSANEAIK